MDAAITAVAGIAVQGSRAADTDFVRRLNQPVGNGLVVVLAVL
jgi:hypothetical protein